MSNYFKHKMRGKSPMVIAGIIVFGIIAITGLAILFGFIIMWLWNWLMPLIFGLTTITFWQAVGLFILAKILFGGFGGGDSGKKNKKNKKYSCDKPSSNRFEKWEHYEEFWESEGSQAFSSFIERKNQFNQSNFED